MVEPKLPSICAQMKRLLCLFKFCYFSQWRNRHLAKRKEKKNSIVSSNTPPQIFFIRANIFQSVEKIIITWKPVKWYIFCDSQFRLLNSFWNQIKLRETTDHDLFCVMQATRNRSQTFNYDQWEMYDLSMNIKISLDRKIILNFIIVCRLIWCFQSKQRS